MESASIEASPANQRSSSTSPNQEGSTYGTPGAIDHPDTSSNTMKNADKDPQLVVSAGRSLKNMLVDLMGVLESQAKSQVFIQGEITLRIEGRDTYSINLFNAEGLEPSDLKIRSDKSSDALSGPAFPNGASSTTASRKRARDEGDNGDASDTAWEGAGGRPKRARVDDDQSEDHSPEVEHDSSRADHRSSSEPPPTISSRFQHVSAQIKWVEECRRIADEAHDKREETWRTTSATFHDDARKVRERHEAWMVNEMTWQHSLLVGVVNDLRGLYPLGHSLKWETPPQPPTASPVPGQPNYNYNGPLGTYNKRPIPRQGASSKPK